MIKVILIDDEELIRSLVRKIIPWEKLDMSVVAEASNGLDGMDVCKRLEPDIIVTDIRMPRMDGLTLLEGLRASGSKAEVILVSGYDDFAYAQRAIKSGAFDYILKPIEEEDLIKILNAVKEKINKKTGDKDYLKKLKHEINKLQLENLNTGNNNIPVECQSNNSIVQKALAYIENNYNADISLDEMAKILFIHNTYFSEIFKREVGKGFNGYVSDLRIEKAKALLLFPHIKINEVSDMVGYSNVSYFIRVFKKNAGVSPCEYRKTK